MEEVSAIISKGLAKHVHVALESLHTAALASPWAQPRRFSTSPHAPPPYQKLNGFIQPDNGFTPKLHIFCNILRVLNLVPHMDSIGHSGVRSRGVIIRSARYQPDFQKILATLWSEVAKPILDILGYTQKLPLDELPRVTWCTIGAISFFPLHAAGCYDGSQPNVSDLVVSSYTLTLSAFLSPFPSIDPDFGILTVGQEQNDDLGNLPGTVKELVTIKEQAKAVCYSQLDGHAATVDAVLNGMEKHSWVHLACHATQNPTNPAHSSFCLHDGSLMLETITKRSFKNKGLAFLSACQTATGDDKLPDEAVHLAAGMQMAGYPSVIATMWSISDIDGPEIAKEVYADLLRDGKMDCTGAARALHKAVTGLRQNVGPELFKRWVPFIHLGV